uniref:Uncharacterized protein n=1 Tax=Panagrolaimus davidi TaxID=227884 RepID=A0A914QW53_9BILA
MLKSGAEKKGLYCEDVIPRHDALEMLANCEQSLTKKGSRRLLLYKKLREPQNDETAFVKFDCYENQSYRDGIFKNPAKANARGSQGDGRIE